VLVQPAWQVKVTRRLQHADTAQVRVRIARDLIRRVRELTRAITDLYEQLAGLARELAPQLLAEKGIGVLIAAKLIGGIAGIQRFQTDAQLARLAGCAPIPVSSGRTDRHRLDRGGNRQLNHAFHMLALTASTTTPRPLSTSPSSAPAARPTPKRSDVSNVTSSAGSTTSSATQPAFQTPSA
jgi:transposase